MRARVQTFEVKVYSPPEDPVDCIDVEEALVTGSPLYVHGAEATDRTPAGRPVVVDYETEEES